MATKHGTPVVITTEEFDTILQGLIVEEAATLLSIPGVYEPLAEHFNNEILTMWENEQCEKAEKEAHHDTLRTMP